MRDHLCNLRWEGKETRGDNRAKLELLSKRREVRLLVIARKGSYKEQLAKGYGQEDRAKEEKIATWPGIKQRLPE